MPTPFVGLSVITHPQYTQKVPLATEDLRMQETPFLPPSLAFHFWTAVNNSAPFTVWWSGSDSYSRSWRDRVSLWQRKRVFGGCSGTNVTKVPSGYPKWPLTKGREGSLPGLIKQFGKNEGLWMDRDAMRIIKLVWKTVFSKNSDTNF